MKSILTDRFGTRKLVASCDLVMHPEGAFTISGKPYRPEWGRMNIPGEDYGVFLEMAPSIVGLAVENANNICKNNDPEHIGLQVYDSGKVRIIVQE